MARRELNVVCSAHGREWRGLADPGGNFGHGSEVDRSGCTINVIIYVSSAIRSAGPGFPGGLAVYTAPNSGKLMEPWSIP
jgi:hypothetical protein